jgi:bifunctional enzyme CysN/CysC
MHGLSPRPGAPQVLRLSVGGVRGDGKTTLCARLAEASQALAGAAATPGPAPQDGRLSFATAQCSFVVVETDSDALDASRIADDAAGNDVLIIVADVRNGLTPQVRHHVAAACTIGIRHLVLAANKLDLTDWQPTQFEAMAEAFRAVAGLFDLDSATAIPISALSGANVATNAQTMPWYDGPTLLAVLESLKVDAAAATRPLRLPIEAVTRPVPDRRHYSGTIASGTLKRGDKVQVAVSGTQSVVDQVLVDGTERDEASAGEAVAVGLADHVDVGSGDILVHPEARPQVAEQFAAHLVWLAEEPLLPGRDYKLKIGTREIPASITSVKYRLDTDTLHHDAARTLRSNEIGACQIAAGSALVVDDFADFPQTGRFALHDRYFGDLIAAGTIDFALRRGMNVHLQQLSVSKSARAGLKRQGACILWFTGLSGAGKSTVANIVEGRLAELQHHTYMLDGDNVRHGLNKDLGFTAGDRVENIRRVGEVAKLFVDAGLIVLCSFISPFRAERAGVRGLVEPTEFLEVYIKAPLDICEQRDPKGLYAKSRSGRLPNFTGIDSPYEEPEAPDLVLDTTSAPADQLAQQVIVLLQSRGLIGPARHG